MGKRKNVDISELYDLFSSRRGCYFVCADISHLLEINEISHKAGDLAILESLRRLNEEAGEEDYVFRIGGDEFVILTASSEESYAAGVARRIIARNGGTYSFEGQELPLSLHIGIVRMKDETVRYNELFDELHTAIAEGIKKGVFS